MLLLENKNQEYQIILEIINHFCIWNLSALSFTGGAQKMNIPLQFEEKKKYLSSS